MKKKLKKRTSFWVKDKERPNKDVLFIEKTLLENGSQNINKIHRLMMAMEPGVRNMDPEEAIKYCYLNYVNYIKKDNPEEYLLNLAKSKNKKYEISVDLKKESWLNIIQNNKFMLENWDIILTKRGFITFVDGYWI